VGRKHYPGCCLFGGRLAGEQGIHLGAVVPPVGVFIKPGHFFHIPGQQQARPVESTIQWQIFIDPADDETGFGVSADRLADGVVMAEEGEGGAFRDEHGGGIFQGGGGPGDHVEA